MNTFDDFKNEKFSAVLKENERIMKKILPSDDILIYSFESGGGVPCAVIYADGMVNKQLLGDLAARPLSFVKSRTLTTEEVKKAVLFPELKIAGTPADAAREILDGNSLLLIQGCAEGVIVGAKTVPQRAVTEPQTSIAIKGPREGFVEDVKTNMALVRKRLKTGNLRFEYAHAGKQSDTSIALCYLEGIADAKVLAAIKKRLSEINTDIIADSSYIATFLAPRRYTLFKELGTTEKPDIFAAKIAEGRVGILVDGSPVALTAPYVLTEDFQTAEDYFVSPFAASVLRLLRFFAMAISLLLPAFYVSSQLFKIQLIPLNLTLTIAGSIRGLPLSPSLEMFLVLLVLEILKEASIRMPKYVGMALSVVGALVLGDTAVSAFLPFFLLSAFICVKDEKAIGRSADLCMPIFLFSFFGLIFMALGEADFSELLPLFGSSAEANIKGVYHSFVHFSDTALMIPLLGAYRYEKGDGKRIVGAYAGGGTFVLLFLAVFYGVFGALAPRETYAFDKIARYFSALDVVGRVDLLLVYLITVVLLYAYALPLQLAVICLCGACGTKRYGKAEPALEEARKADRRRLIFSLCINGATMFFVLTGARHYRLFYSLMTSKLFFVFPIFSVLLPLSFLLLKGDKKNEFKRKKRA